ncbi:hypothetical protein BaRGS_00033781 [Batillaria attramentaria]|uniref:Uncharacterized protein n=1 Tax=Batillaria attramentaria TaxID=370345 RepID=A0ABD0JJY5_9CAEN
MEAKIGQNSKDVADIPTAEERVGVRRDDLFAWDAVYHDVCSVNLRIHRNIPARFTRAKKQKPSSALGNHQQTRQYAFMKVCQCLEHNDDEQTTLTDPVSRMKVFCGDGVYANTPEKNKLLEHFGSHILISSRGTKTNV